MTHYRTICVVARAALVVTFALASLWATVDARAQMSTGANTDPDATARHTSADAIGRSAGAWLELQRTNAQAAPALPMPGAQATLAYERYMNSFRTKIPESFGSSVAGASSGARAGAGQPSGAN